MNKKTRIDWVEYFMDFTDLAARRSTCTRRTVGAVIVLENHVISSGYNGAPRGVKHCEQSTCLRTVRNIPSGSSLDICRGLHGEQNAIVQAAYHGHSTKGAVMYSTTFPCLTCMKMIINAGITKVYYRHAYESPDSRAMALAGGVELIRFG